MDSVVDFGAATTTVLPLALVALKESAGGGAKGTLSGTPSISRATRPAVAERTGLP